MKANRTIEKKKSARVTRGSANVFSDLGFKPAQAAELKIKAELTRQIYNRIRALGLTQIQAAARLGLSQPDVSKSAEAWSALSDVSERKDHRPRIRPISSRVSTRRRVDDSGKRRIRFEFE